MQINLTIVEKYFVIVLILIGFHTTHAQLDTFYLKNRFNENGTVITKDTTFMWAPLFYVNASNDQPVSGVIVEKFRRGERITHAKDGFTLKQKSVLNKYTFFIFYDPNSRNFATIHYWNKKKMFKSYCIDKNSFGVEYKYLKSGLVKKEFYEVECKNLKNGEVSKTTSKKEEMVSIEYMIKFLIETIPQYRVEILEIFADDLN